MAGGLGLQPGELEGVAEAIREMELAAQKSARLVLLYVGQKTIEFLRSYTGQYAPPIRPGDPPRRRHPGYWADRKGFLAASYGFEVVASLGGWELVLSNTAEYAVHLEARDGYYVLTGVTDRGGPVEEALRAAIAVVAPDWEIQSYD